MQKTSQQSTLTLPIILTLIRLIISPFLLPMLLVNGLSYESLYVNYALAGVFVLLALTDFFDGYFARKLGQESELGKILDPLADKFLLYSCLIGLLVADKIYYYWVIIFIGREFFIMGLRLVALENKIRVTVSKLGKVKTATQFMYLMYVIVDPVFFTTNYYMLFSSIHCILLGLALGFSIGSAYNYYKNFLNALKRKDDGAHS